MNIDFKKNTEKITLPVAIILGVLIITIGYYAVQVNKQKSIEKQQSLQIEQEKQKEILKAEQAKKDFGAKRKNDCLNIYETEGKKWSNVSGWHYSEDEDLCYIRYKDSKPKTTEECDKNYPIGGSGGLTLLNENILCKNGEFEKTF